MRPPPTPESNLLPPPPVARELPKMTDEQRARAVAHMEELLAHLHDPPSEDEPDWDVEALFPPGRER